MFKQCFVLLVLGFLNTAAAIKCYKCNSIGEFGCDAEKMETYIRQVDCDLAVRPNSRDLLLPVTKCLKKTAENRIHTIVIRDCYFETANQKADECLVEQNLHDEKCYTCTGDLCNASSPPATAGRFIAAAILALVAFNLTL